MTDGLSWPSSGTSAAIAAETSLLSSNSLRRCTVHSEDARQLGSRQHPISTRASRTASIRAIRWSFIAALLRQHNALERRSVRNIRRTTWLSGMDEVVRFLQSLRAGKGVEEKARQILVTYRYKRPLCQKTKARAGSDTDEAWNAPHPGLEVPAKA